MIGCLKRSGPSALPPSCCQSVAFCGSLPETVETSLQHLPPHDFSILECIPSGEVGGELDPELGLGPALFWVPGQKWGVH